MTRLESIAMTILLFLSFTSQAQPYDPLEYNQSNPNAEIASVSEVDQSTDITFLSGKIIEIAYATLEGGKEERLGKEYFPKILPIAAKYGGKSLGSFQVLAVVDGEVKPQIVAIFEWPSFSAHKQLLNDREAKKVFPIRDEVLTSIKLSYFTVEKDVTVNFKANKTYEFFNAWLTPEAKTALPKYFKQSHAPKLKYGPPKFLVDLKPAPGIPNESYILRPQMAGIVEWNSVATYYGLAADPDFQKTTHLLKKSVSRLDMIQTRINIPQ